MTEDIKINRALLPLSWLYGLGVGIRNKLFDWGILPSEEFSIPVISIGNLSVGGTGKTPHTEYIIRLLSSKYKIAILSRGYKRKTKGFIIADEKASAKRIGDEPYQMFRKFPGIIVAVDADRRRGIKKLLKLEEKKRPEIIILDDAYQHRYLIPSLSILLSDHDRPFYTDALLPAGKLREPGVNNNRANLIICTKCPSDIKPIDFRIISNNMELYPYQELFFTGYKYKGPRPLFPEASRIQKESIEQLQKKSYSFLLIAGLANPQPLISYVSGFTKDLTKLLYSDHHFFSRRDIAEITSKFKSIKNNHKIIITSEKDGVRLLNNKYIPADIKKYIFYLPITISFHQKQESLFIQKIENHVKDFARNRIMA